MKRIIKGIIIVLLLTITKVNAANYELKELIPHGIKTTIVTDNFSYQELSYDSGQVTFKNVKNISDEAKPMSISIALFNNEKKNIGTINYCNKDDILNSKEEKSYTISINSKYLAKKNKINDIKYIAILNDNINCRVTGSEEYVDQNIKEIGTAKNTSLNDQAKYLIYIIGGIGIILFALFILKLLFTNSYENFDGDEVRKGYEKYNKQLAEEREHELEVNPPKPKEVKKVKSDEVIKQEEEAQNEDKSGTDLHNLYK